MSTENFNHVAFLWSIAESLRGTYKEEDYRKVMIPMIVLRRFDCLLEKYNREEIKEVCELYDVIESRQEREKIILDDLKENHKINLPFYNTSNFTWKNC